MRKQSPNTKPQALWVIIVSALTVGVIFALGAISAWSALVRWLPKEEVAVRITDTDSHQSFRLRPAGSSISYWIEVVDEHGLKQNISCEQKTYATLTPIGISGGNLKLVRNPLTKTPIAFLRSKTDVLNIDPESALGKLLTAGKESRKPTPPERLELVKYPFVFLFIGFAFMTGAVWILIRFLKITGNRTVATLANLITMIGGTIFGICWSSGLL